MIIRIAIIFVGACVALVLGNCFGESFIYGTGISFGIIVGYMGREDV